MGEGTSRIGDYQVLGHWTSGSVSHVYVARRDGEPDSSRLYALKVPRTEYAIYAANESVFFRGENRGPQIVHPHTISTREVLDRDGRLYMVTDFVNGELLSRVLEARRGEPWPPSLAIMIAQHIARSLIFIHESQPAESFRPHAELSPANVSLGYDGRARLIDCAIIGKRRQFKEVRHLAPEQAAELPDLDARCDIYGLGLVLWEMLVGQPALTGRDDTEIRASALEGRIQAPSQRGAHCDAGVDEVVMQALAVERDHRPSTARAFEASLSALLDRIAPKRDLEADLREVLQRVFPRGASRLPRLVQRWSQPRDARLLHRRDGPLAAIRQAMGVHRQSARQPFMELDATIEALSQGLPVLTGDLARAPTMTVDLAPKRLPRRALLSGALLVTAGGAAAAWRLANPPGISVRPQGSLRVVTSPPGAEVSIDGQVVGQTPLSLDGLPVDGSQQVLIVKPGFAPVRRELKFSGEGGRRGWDLELQRLPEADEGPGEDFKDNPY